MFLGSLYAEAWRGWALGATSADAPNMLFVEWLCEELAKSHEQEFAALLSSIVERSYDAHVVISTAISIATHHRMEGDLPERVSTMLKEQKTLFEAFKHWGSVPYFFAVKAMGAKTEAKTPEQLSLVSAGEKFRTIKGLKITVLARGDLKDLLGRLDNKVRNAGDGHDSWSITDDKKIVLKDIEPKSGTVKGEITFDDEDALRLYIRDCARALWILEMGINLFKINSPAFWNKVAAGRKFKVQEIRDQLDSFLSDRWMEIADFKLDREKKTCELTIKRIVKRIKTENSSITFSNGQHFAFVQKEFKTPYKHTMLDAMIRLVHFIEPQDMPQITLRVLDEKGNGIADMDFQPDELQKLYKPAKEENIPQPSRGTWPDSYNHKVLEIPVEPAFQEVMQTLLDSLPEEEDAMNEATEKMSSEFAKYSVQ